MKSVARGDVSGALVRSVEDLRGTTFDLVVIGAGLTGAAVARCAVSVGLSVAVLDEADFASGASSRTPKLAHGELDSLQRWQTAIAEEAAQGRLKLHRLAPHLAEPINALVPLRGRLEWLKYRLRISVFEVLGRVRTAHRARRWMGSMLRDSEAFLRVDRFPRCWSFLEFLTDDARLVLALLRDASKKGAICANYVGVEKVARRGRLHFVHLKDRVSGRELLVYSRTVVNATGAWTEQIAVQAPDTYDFPRPEQRHAVSRCINVAVARDRLPINNVIVMREGEKRTVYAVPRGTVTYMSSVDIATESAAERWPQVGIDDVEKLLQEAERYFSGCDLRPEDVISTWASQRPLIRQPGQSGRELAPQEDMWVDDNEIINVAGGCFAGFFHRAERVAAQIGRQLEFRVEFEEESLPLPGGDLSLSENLDQRNNSLRSLRPEVARLAVRYGISDDVALRLVRLYGSEVEMVLGVNPRPLSRSVFAEEVVWAVDVEGAISLEDVLYRRIRCVYFESQELTELVPAVCDQMTVTLGWSAEEQRRQRIELENRLAFDLAAVPLGG